MNYKYVEDRLRRFYEKSELPDSLKRDEDNILKNLRERLEPRIEALKASTRLTEKDYQLRVNV